MYCVVFYIFGEKPFEVDKQASKVPPPYSQTEVDFF